MTNPYSNGWQKLRKKIIKKVDKETKDDAKKNKEVTEIFNKALADLRSQIENFNNFSN